MTPDYRSYRGSGEERDILHVEERMEERVDELCRLYHESREFVLHSRVDVLVVIGRLFEVLFKLRP